jgi:hypothetical protein
VIERVDRMKEETGMSIMSISTVVEEPYRTLMRWRQRQRTGKPLARRPGPAKVGSFDLDTLMGRIRDLSFGKERTAGAGALYRKYSHLISRRDFYVLLDHVRQEVEQNRAELERVIDWRIPGVVWSMDDADVNPVGKDHGHMNVVHDLGSSFTLRVLGSADLANGWTVAANLVQLFEMYGPPLFLKMDNAKNLNHKEVLRALDEYGVIPLNSPPYYPPYNGGMEHKQGEIKKQLSQWIGADTVSERELKLAAGLSGHELNHKRRRHLRRRTACCLFEAGRPFLRQFTRRERKEVLAEVTTLAIDIAGQLEQHTDAAVETALRYAAETWMQLNNVITVTRKGEVLPPFYQIMCH